ncbi:hypothetical protein D9V30_05055 [Mycetocola reblochoni]|uniref:Uncharacterized protein n=2 Tax=Mycetocola reblochoni TaxID=331618 RepID=A0A1R4JAN7_9MICO|nr:hypothetical protein D9V30_05055 [Mycetocola reblochoni]SJN29049.1 hypothetical protein FM119_06360 [Mycetocola reblochoni REB411]
MEGASGATARRFGVLDIVLAIPFGLLLAYDVFEAIGNLIGGLSLAGSLDTTLSPIGWAALILGVVAPVALFLLAAILGRGRDLLARVLLYLAALGLSAVIGLNILGQFGSMVSLLA